MPLKKKLNIYIYEITSTKEEYDRFYETILVYAMYKIGFIQNLSVRQIIFIVVCNYLNNDEVKELKTDIANVYHNRRFLTTISKHFDFERLIDNPFLWQDIWIYNYIKYDMRGRLAKGRLILKYQNEVLLPQISIFKEIHAIMPRVLLGIDIRKIICDIKEIGEEIIEHLIWKQNPSL